MKKERKKQKALMKNLSCYKKILVIVSIVAAFFIGSCCNQPQIVVAKSKDEELLEIEYVDTLRPNIVGAIVVDKSNGVNYIAIFGGNGVAITPRLQPTGKPYVSE